MSAAKSQSFRGRVKREAGENPARSRHCVRESVPYITAKAGRGKRALIEARRPAVPGDF